MKKIQNNLLRYIECTNDTEEDYQNIVKMFDDEKIKNNRHQLKMVLYILLKISNNHHRSCNFFSKIEKIFLIFKNEITKYFTNSEIFNIFRSNKRILLFLIEERMIIIDESIVKKIISDKYKKKKYHQYFFPEIKSFLSESLITELNFQVPNNFQAKRKHGENEEYVWQLIRNDFVDEFKVYVEQTKLLLSSKITNSIFETNSFLVKKNPTLIEYSAFFGSIQILKYLQSNNIELSPSLWIYAIHSQKVELIHFLEENNVKPQNGSFFNVYEESIKCHHNEIAKYIQTELIQKFDETSMDFLIQSLENYNFNFIPYKAINKYAFCYLCRYDYFQLVDVLLKFTVFDKNMIYSIFFFFFFIEFLFYLFVFIIFLLIYFFGEISLYSHFNKILFYIYS